MSEQLSAEDRKRILDRARRSLALGNQAEMAAALKCLPLTGAKALALRSELSRALSRCKSAPALVLGSVPASTQSHDQFVDGVRYVFEVVDAAPDRLFRVVAQGGIVRVEVNCAHAAFMALQDSGKRLLTPPGRSVLLAWVMLERDAGSPRRREKVEDAANEWARALGAAATEWKLT